MAAILLLATACGDEPRPVAEAARPPLRGTLTQARKLTSGESFESLRRAIPRPAFAPLP